MKEHLKLFTDFVNEELNYRFVSDTECHLTRRWYYYNTEDDIVYGSDERPSGDFPLVFENNIEGLCLMSVNIDTLETSFFNGEAEILEYLYENNIGEIDFTSEYSDEIQGFFENFDDTRFILMNGTQIVASTLDVIEEN